MKKSPVISVIVPVYKVEKHLSRCVESILAQSFTDFELLLIDDGSPDACGVICDEYALKDNRIRVFHQMNAGVSAARNRGLDEAKGEYIVFVDSDDWVLPDYLLHLYDSRPLSSAFWIVQGYAKVQADIVKEETCLTPAKYAGREISHLFINDEIREMRGPVSKLFQRSIIEENKLRFPLNISFGEDTIFNFHYLLYCQVVIVGRAIDYMYCDTVGSLTKILNDFVSEYATFKCYHICLVQLAEKLKMEISEMKSSFRFSVLFFQRALISDYRSRRKMRFSVRTQHFRQISSDCREFMLLYYHPGYKADWLGRYFLLHGWILCYNFYTSFLYAIHFKWMFGVPKKKIE